MASANVVRAKRVARGTLTTTNWRPSSSPFAQQGGMGRVYQLFGTDLPKVLEAMNWELAA